MCVLFEKKVCCKNDAIRQLSRLKGGFEPNSGRRRQVSALGRKAAEKRGLERYRQSEVRRPRQRCASIVARIDLPALYMGCSAAFYAKGEGNRFISADAGLR